MIHFHGGPVTPTDAAIALWTRRHAMVSFERPDQVELAFEICQTVRLDNGAFAKWQQWLKERAAAGMDHDPNWEPSKRLIDIPALAAWVREWERHPAYDGCMIPDDIEGDEAANDKLIALWLQQHPRPTGGIPVWHLHESLERLRYLVQCTRGGVYPCVALGSSGKWSQPGTVEWWNRMDEAMQVVCDEKGRPLCKLHGLRMLSPTIFSHLPLAAADSCNVARNIGLDTRWTGAYAPLTPLQRALVLAERIESHAAATRWSRRHGVQQNLELIG